MISFDDVLSDLAETRPIFHSERDFQIALAQRITEIFPNAQVRLEKPFVKDNKYIYLDLWVDTKFTNVIIELKYKTKKLEFKDKDDVYVLKSHSAQDYGRYDYLKDIQRLESVVYQQDGRRAYALILTNDDLYWKEINNPKTNDSEFRIHNGQLLSGKMEWGPKTGAGTLKNHEQPIVLRNDYTAKWKDYSDLNLGKDDKFRYLLLKIERNDQD